MLAIALILVARAGAARADGDKPFPHMIAVTSLTAPAAPVDPDQPLVRVLTGEGGDWCEPKPPGGVSHPLTITLAEPTAIDAIAVRQTSLSRFNAITSVEITADGKLYKQAAAGKDEIVIAIGGAPVSSISVVVTGKPRGDIDDSCVSSIELRTTPPSAIALGVDAKAAAALEPTVVALERAFKRCDRKGLAALAHPFEFTTVDEDNDGMHWHPHTYKTAAAALKACKARKLAPIATSLPRDDLAVRATGPGKISLYGGFMTWDMELVDGAWRLVAVAEG
jgi:hypothetical protein